MHFELILPTIWIYTLLKKIKTTEIIDETGLYIEKTMEKARK